MHIVPKPNCGISHGNISPDILIYAARRWWVHVHVFSLSHERLCSVLVVCHNRAVQQLIPFGIGFAIVRRHCDPKTGARSSVAEWSEWSIWQFDTIWQNWLSKLDAECVAVWLKSWRTLSALPRPRHGWQMLQPQAKTLTQIEREERTLARQVWASNWRYQSDPTCS